MTSIDRQLADAVRDLLIAAELSIPSVGEPFTDEQIKRVYLPRFEIKDLESLQIVIAPRARSIENRSRASQQRSHAVQIGVLQKCKPDSELMEELIDLVADIDDSLADVRLPLPSTAYPATWAGSTCDEIYNVESLEQHGVFRSVITANYQVAK